jgi:Amt family ammonium transporter
MAYQGTFCIITAALISGAIVERMRFSAYLIFISLWSVVVYAPIAHWVWGGGWLADMGALDFAGGTVVHVNAGVAALVAAFVVGARRDYKKSPLQPHNVPFTLLGAGLLWFGWFGFNAGSALAAGELAGLAFTTTFLAPMGTLVVWTILDYMRLGKPTAVGAATGIVVGLVAITPAAGFIGPMSAIALGAIAAVPSYFGLIFRAKTQLDDSLDVVAAHGVGGTVGALLTGVFAQKALNSAGNDGLLFGNPGQLGVQAMAVVAAMVYSGAVSFILLKIIGAVVPLRATAADESVGLDLSVHGEEAYVQPGSGAASAH